MTFGFQGLVQGLVQGRGAVHRVRLVHGREGKYIFAPVSPVFALNSPVIFPPICLKWAKNRQICPKTAHRNGCRTDEALPYIRGSSVCQGLILGDPAGGGKGRRGLLPHRRGNHG
jgi:hypothetical protein